MLQSINEKKDFAKSTYINWNEIVAWKVQLKNFEGIKPCCKANLKIFTAIFCTESPRRALARSAHARHQSFGSVCAEASSCVCNRIASRNNSCTNDCCEHMSSRLLLWRSLSASPNSARTCSNFSFRAIVMYLMHSGVLFLVNSTAVTCSSTCCVLCRGLHQTMTSKTRICTSQTRLWWKMDSRFGDAKVWNWSVLCRIHRTESWNIIKHCLTSGFFFSQIWPIQWSCSNSVLASRFTVSATCEKSCRSYWIPAGNTHKCSMCDH